MNRTAMRWGLTISLLALAVLAAGGAVRADTPTSQPDASAEAFAHTVAKLAHSSYRVREQATADLAAMDYQHIDRLAAAYKRVDHPEVRLRIRTAAREMFYASKRAGEQPQGFLGITHTQEPIILPDENRSAEAVLVVNVWPDSPAADAGLKSGDRVITVDGKPVAGQADGGFAGQVRDLKPGHELKMTVVREGEKLDVSATLSSRRKFNVDTNEAEWEPQFERMWKEKFDPDARAAAGPHPQRWGGNIRMVGGGEGVVIIEQVEDGVVIRRQVVPMNAPPDENEE